MYQGKFRKKSGFRMKKSTTMLVSVGLTLSLLVLGTVAYLTTKSSPIKNIFNPSQVTTKVVENWDGTVKKDVKIQNTGDIDAWIRATYVVTWQNAAGEIYGVVPVENTDYIMKMDLKNGWLKGNDGFYYWTKPVASEATSPDSCYTGIWITECKPVKAAPAEGYYLTVEIIGSGLQSKPNSTFNSSWGASSGLTAANDALTKNS